jgi:hypothetical protein
MASIEIIVPPILSFSNSSGIAVISLFFCPFELALTLNQLQSTTSTSSVTTFIHCLKISKILSGDRSIKTRLKVSCDGVRFDKSKNFKKDSLFA